MLETFRDVNEIGAAIRAVRSVSDLPIVAQMTTEEDGNSLDGVAPETFVPDLERAAPTSSALNCSVGPAAMLETLERMAARRARQALGAAERRQAARNRRAQHLSLLARVHGVVRAAVHQQRRAPRRRLLRDDAGAHPADQDGGAIAGAGIDVRRRTRAAAPVARSPGGTPSRLGAACEQKSRMANALARGGFVVCVELVPPRGYRADALVEQARQLKIRGVDLVNIPDGPLASARMSALSAAVLVQQQAGVETILHYACRDRNLLGMQSDLLGAHAMGVRNLLLVTGDPPTVGDYPDATAVFDVDSIGLTNVVVAAEPRRSTSAASPSASRPAFTSAWRSTPAALNLDEELRRFAYKVEAGAEFAVTRPVFDVARVQAVPRADRRAPDSDHRRHHAARECAPRRVHGQRGPGVRMPDAVVERMRRRTPPAARAAEGLAIAREIAAEIRPLVQGIHAPGTVATASRGRDGRRGPAPAAHLHRGRV